MQKTKIMRMPVRARGVRGKVGLDLPMERSLNVLRSVSSIATACADLKKQRNTSPDDRIFVRLAQPGPEVHAAANGHMLPTAWPTLAGDVTHPFQLRTIREQFRLQDRGLRHKMAASGTAADALPKPVNKNQITSFTRSGWPVRTLRAEFVEAIAKQVCIGGTSNNWRPVVIHAHDSNWPATPARGAGTGSWRLRNPAGGRRLADAGSASHPNRLRINWRSEFGSEH